MHDRDYYRALHTSELVLLAREEGINTEMAIAMADKLAGRCGSRVRPGQFHFNYNSIGDQSK